jgi:hypothetical protein
VGQTTSQESMILQTDLDGYLRLAPSSDWTFIVRPHPWHAFD